MHACMVASIRDDLQISGHIYAHWAVCHIHSSPVPKDRVIQYPCSLAIDPYLFAPKTYNSDNLAREIKQVTQTSHTALSFPL